MMAVGIEETHEEKKEMAEMATKVSKELHKEVGMTKPEYEQNVQTLANLEAIRVNQFKIFNLRAFRDGSVTANNPTSQRVSFSKFSPGYIYIITSICAHDPDDAAHQIQIGIIDGVTPSVYQSATVAGADDSVEYVGQLMCKETDIIYVDFLAVGETDKLYVSMNGYKIRR